MKYSYIWFDLGLTLVKPTIGARYQQALSAMGIHKELADIDRAFHLANKTFMRDYPRVLENSPEFYMSWYLGVVNYHFGIQIPLEKAYSAFAEQKKTSEKRWELIEGAWDTLNQIRSMGYRTGLISNWDSTCRSVLKDSLLESVLDTVIFSSEVGAEKPQSKIFEIALDRAGVKPEQCLHVGDNYYDDIKGAQGVGMNSLLISPYGQLGLEEIKDTPVISCVKEVLEYLE